MENYENYYTAKDGSTGLLKRDEVKTLCGKHGYNKSDFQLTSYKVTVFQEELESVAAWFQRKDSNGEYLYVIKAFRDPGEPNPWGLTIPEAIDQLITIATDWHDECLTDDDRRERRNLRAIIDRLRLLRAGVADEYRRRLRDNARLLYAFGTDYPQEHDEYMKNWIALVGNRKAYDVSMDEILKIKKEFGL